MSNTLYFDIESYGLDPRLPGFRLLMVGIYDGIAPVQIYLEGHTAEAAAILGKHQAAGGRLVAWNAPFDSRVLHQVHGVDLRPHDPMLMYYALREDIRHDLKSTAVLRLGVEPWEHGLRDKIAKGEVPAPSELARYCATDCVYLARLDEDLRHELLENSGLARLYRYLLLPASWAFRRIRERGIYVSQDVIEASRKVCGEKADAARKQLVALAREVGVEGLNPNSPKQLSNLLYDRLHLPVFEWTEHGFPSTNALVLKRLRGRHPISDALLEFRKWDKLGNFLNQYEAHRDEEGRMHPDYALHFTVTGRTSSQGPNIQQIPREELIRSVIVAPPGKRLIVADYSQIELRVIADLSQEPNMRQAFLDGEDLHRLMASKITGKPPEQVTKEERSLAKPVNFGFAYGAEVPTFQDYVLKEFDLVVSAEDGKRYRDAFFALWPGLWPWYEKVYEFVKEHGYVISSLGRVRHLPDIWAPKADVRAEALRQAINSPVQATASDIALTAMTMLELDYGYQVVMFGHDSIILEGDLTEADVAQVKRIMEQEAPDRLQEVFGWRPSVPLVADVALVRAWA